MKSTKNKAAVALGRLAAKKNLAKGKEYFSDLGRKSSEKRKQNRMVSDLSPDSICNERSLVL